MISIDRGLPNIRFWGWIVLFLALCLKLAQWVIFDFPAMVGFVGEFGSVERFFVQWGMPMVNGAIFLAIAGWLPCSRSVLVALLLVGAVVAGGLLAWGQDQYVVYVAYLFAFLPLAYFLFLSPWRRFGVGVAMGWCCQPGCWCSFG